MTAAQNALQLLFGVGGIYTSFLYYGSLQEDVLHFSSPQGQKFIYSWLLQIIEAAANVLLGCLCMLVFEGVRIVPQKPYVISGGVQVLAKYCTTAAMVSGVSFPVATLAKSSKMVPVMIGSLLLGKATYNFREYLHVVLIVAGTAIVSMSGNSKPGASNSVVGLAFLIAALACDGIVGGTQKGMKKALADNGMKEQNFEMQFLTNLYMFITALLFCLTFGELMPGYKYLVENPAIVGDILKFAACSAVGQAFIFYTISRFDPLVCSTVTTTRKVFSVLLSIFLKGHHLNFVGWMGIFMACSGILGELEEKFSASRKPKHNVHAREPDLKKDGKTDSNGGNNLLEMSSFQEGKEGRTGA